MSNPIILAHGGAGAPNEHSDGPEGACRAALPLLTDSEPDGALRAVIEAAVILEDDVRFNAGMGGNMRLDGSLQLDAIVATSDGRIGGVAAIEGVRNPVRVARLVMDSPHVLLAGDGATQFARHRGFAEEDVRTEKAIARHQAALERLRTGEVRPTEQRWRGKDMHGTIGAVARDASGQFAVSCSTGGTSMMLRGRVGDSPIFGAGVMVGEHGAVCATGDGEEIIRRVASMRVYLRMQQGQHPQEAAEAEVAALPAPYTVGFIVVGKEHHGMAATDDRMARGLAQP
jgi:L-asparaginase / beta-aspartyl-peptidase